MTVLTAGMAVLVRTTRVADTVVPFTGTVVGTVDAPAMVVTVAHATHVPVVEHTVRTMFVTAPAPLAELIAIDPVIAGLEARYPGLRPVLQLTPSPPSSVLSVRSKSTYDGPRPPAVGSPRRLGVSTHSAPSRSSALLPNVSPLSMSWPLRALQLTTRKAEYIVALATAVATGGSI